MIYRPRPTVIFQDLQIRLGHFRENVCDLSA